MLEEEEKHNLSIEERSATAAELAALASSLPCELASRLSDVVAENREALVKDFYDNLLANAEAAPFLSPQIVQDRLQHSMRQWLAGLFETRPIASDVFIRSQRKIGAIHARIQVPIFVVMQGARLIKSGIIERLKLLQLPAGDMIQLITYTYDIIDLAVGVMSEAFVEDSQATAQVDQAYRAFALGQDVSLERESQRAALMEWSQSVLLGLYGTSGEEDLPPLGRSDFGLWLQHKAPIIFAELPELDKLRQAVQQMDEVILRRLLDSRSDKTGKMASALEDFQAAIGEIKFLLTEMFRVAAGLESGRDPLTRMLNRRFLSSILTREIKMASTTDTGLSVLLVDVDRFKDINDRYGHSAGDVVIQKIAEAILASSRSSDFVFRYGGEEFLIVLAEADNHSAMAVAEQIRLAIGAQEIALPDGSRASITASIGVATFNGHPDYRYLIEAADKALYKAKQKGRNRCESADFNEPQG